MRRKRGGKISENWKRLKKHVNVQSIVSRLKSDAEDTRKEEEAAINQIKNLFDKPEKIKQIRKSLENITTSGAKYQGQAIYVSANSLLDKLDKIEEGNVGLENKIMFIDDFFEAIETAPKGAFDANEIQAIGGKRRRRRKSTKKKKRRRRRKSTKKKKRRRRRKSRK